MAKRRKKKKGEGIKKPWAFALGLLIIALAVVGAGFLVRMAAQNIRQWTDDGSKLAEYENFLVPVVMNDPESFDDVTKASMQQLIDITIWSMLHSNPSTSEYEDYEDGDRVGLIIPAEKVDAQFAKIFGTDIKPIHNTVSGSSYDFTYEAARKGYLIPLTGVTPTYIPKVYEAKRSDKLIVLVVGYVPAEELAQDKTGKIVEPEPDKFMKITLREHEEGYIISAIQATDAPEAITVKKTAAPTQAPTESPQESSSKEQQTQSSAPTQAPSSTTAGSTGINITIPPRGNGTTGS